MPVGIHEQLKAGRTQKNYGGANTPTAPVQFQQTNKKQDDVRHCQNMDKETGLQCGKPLSQTMTKEEVLCMSCRTKAESDAFLARHRKNTGMIH